MGNINPRLLFANTHANFSQIIQLSDGFEPPYDAYKASVLPLDDESIKPPVRDLNPASPD